MPLLINAACTKAVISVHGTPSLESNSIIFESGGCKYVGCVSASCGVQDGASGLCSHVRRCASSSQTSFDGIIIIQNLYTGIGTMQMLFGIEGKLWVA
jgi:hypothetical protein